ncbi:MAG: L,D-transpeptidase [Solirubrobacterales bacterium]
MAKLGQLIRRHPALAAVSCLAVGLVVLLAAGGGSGEGDDRNSDSLTGSLQVALSYVARPAQPEVAPAPPPDERGRTARRDPNLNEVATVLPGREVVLRRSPNGERVALLGSRTEFGSDRNLWIARRHGDWLGVPTEVLPDSRLGWIRADASRLRVSVTPYRIDADISERELRLLRGKRVVERFPVTVGGPGSPTPPGRYSVTDGLTTSGALTYYYGCCVLALNGHQPNLPAGWIGGDRIAIHGTAGGIGGAASAGCLRASDADMVALFRRVPLGTPVLIRR